MAKKLKKGTKQFLSVLLHLAVLVCMVVLYDAGKVLIDRYKPEEAGKEKTGEAGEDGKAQAKKPEEPKKGKDGGAGRESKPEGTSMADLMKQKAKRKAESQ